MTVDAIFAAMNKTGNRVVLPLMSKSPLAQRVFGRLIAVVTYTGRRTGRTFTMPVFYFRRRDTVTIGVALPDSKRWWRNFLGDGAPISLTMAGRTHTGHAVAIRDSRGAVKVVTQLASATDE